MLQALPNPSVADRWCLVVPVKRLDHAKSRLAGPAAEHRVAFALAFAADTVAAALRAPAVVGVIAVTDDETVTASLRRLGATVVPDAPDSGLNPALRHGAQAAAFRHPGAGIGALSADLPALRHDELNVVLCTASGRGTAVVADARGDGTTAYLTEPGHPFRPEFGPTSLRAHVVAGAHPLATAGVRSVRRDVDTVDDLLDAVALGVGPATAEVLAGINRREWDRLLMAPHRPGG